MRLPKLYGKYILMHLKSQMQYKVSFLLTVLAQFFLTFALFFSLWFMMDRFRTVQGFTFPQVLLCFSIVTLAFAIAECFARGFDMFSRMISNGEFDRVLVRPRSTIFMTLVSYMEFSRVGRLVQAAIMLVYAIPNSGVAWSAAKVLTLVLMAVGGIMVFAALFLLRAAFAFFTIEGLEFMNILIDGGKEFGQYPYSIYGPAVLRILTYVVPLALFQYYPLLYLLDIVQNPLYMLLPLLCGLFFIPVYIFWRFGLRHYKSTGS